MRAKGSIGLMSPSAPAAVSIESVQSSQTLRGLGAALRCRWGRPRLEEAQGWWGRTVPCSWHASRQPSLSPGGASCGGGRRWGGARREVTEMDGLCVGFIEAGKAPAPAERCYGLKYTVRNSSFTQQLC